MLFLVVGMKVVFVLHIVLMLRSCSSGLQITKQDILSYRGPNEDCHSVPSATIEKSIDVPIVFYGQQYSTINVNTAGTISFSTAVAGLFILRLKTTIPFDASTAPFLSPLWTTARNGAFCYWNSTNTSVVNTFVNFLDSDENLFQGFTPTLVLMMTWKGFEIAYKEPMKNVTYQVILVTNGKRSFSKFLYHQVHDETQFLIGFNAGDMINGLLLARDKGPFTPDLEDRLSLLYRIDGDCVAPANTSCGYQSYLVPSNATDDCSCRCYSGFRLVKKSCIDIDECLEGRHNCTSDRQYCHNTIGSFDCHCKNGYTRNSTNTSCEDDNECEDDRHNCTGEGQYCSNVMGSFECSCTKGYEKNLTTTSCEDLNECEISHHNCTSDQTCSNTNGSFVCSAKPQESSNQTTELISGLVVGIAIIFLIGLIILVVIILKRRRRSNWNFPSSIIHRHDYIGEIQRPSFHHTGSMIQLFKLPKELKIPFESLEFDSKMIGEGEFGTVYKAKYNKEVVAVKILKGISGTYEVRNAVEEIMRMKQFTHPHILSLMGVAIDHHFSPCIVMPFMWNGSLDRFLQKEENRATLLFPPDSTAIESDVEKATSKLLEICLQISQGMAYLSKEKIIHRDLAARNCMIDSNQVIKVADFGLSVSLGENTDYYKLTDTSGEKLPVKWMAIESLTDKKFSEASDVWSFGLTCWEVFSGGRKPYPEVMNRDLIRELCAGYRMSKPLNRACLDSIFNIISSCWQQDPADRPTFVNLESQISSLLLNLTEYLCLDVTQELSTTENHHVLSHESINTDSELK